MRLMSTAAIAVAAASAIETPILNELVAELHEDVKGMPIVGQAFPENFFGRLDYIAGFTIGFYNPLQKRWRQKDCRARFMTFAVNILGYAKYFDKPYNPTTGAIAKSALQAAFTLNAAQNLIKTCSAQLEEIQTSDNPWTENFNLMSNVEDPYDAGYWNHPEVGIEGGLVVNILHGLGIILDLLAVRSTAGSGFYYFMGGKALGSAIGHTITGFDNWFSLGLIEPMKPWERFLQDAEEAEADTSP